MAYHVNGSDITSNWVTTAISQSGETGYHDGGVDLAQKYGQCINNSCSGGSNPVCESIPTQYYGVVDSISFWTGNCVTPPS